MNVRNYRFGLIFVFVAVVLLSCAPSARIPVLKPAEINLRGIDKIAIGDVQGNIGSSVADLLTSRLFESDQFDVVDRSNLSRIMKEHELNMSGAVDTDTAVKIGRLVGASALIVGNANVKYDLKRWKKKPWQDKEGKWHQSYNVKGTAKVNSTLKVIGLTTGKVLAVKSISKEAGDSDWKNNEWPQDPDRDAIISSAVNSMIDTFMKMIAPYNVYVNVKYRPFLSSISQKTFLSKSLCPHFDTLIRGSRWLTLQIPVYSTFVLLNASNYVIRQSIGTYFAVDSVD